MQAVNAQDVVQSYIDAFQAQDLERCVEMYDDNASVEFGPATYQGKKALEDWHKARFKANLQLVRIEDVSVDGHTVTVAGAVTSKRLKSWRIGTLTGRAIFQVQDGKIADVRFGLRMHNPFDENRG